MFRERGTPVSPKYSLFPTSVKSGHGCDFCESGYDTERTLTTCRCGSTWKESKHINENNIVNDSNIPQDSPSFNKDEFSPKSRFKVPTRGSLDSRPSQAKMMHQSPYEVCSSTLGRLSPGPDLGYHTLVPRQTPTPSREVSTPSPWQDVPTTPISCIDICAFTSCPRSSPRPQLPQIPSTPRSTLTPSNGILETTEQLISAYKGKRSSKSSLFDRLPEALLLKIFSYLPSYSLCQAGRVCRKWHTLAWHHSLWESVTLNGESLNADRAIKQVLKLIARGSGRCDHIKKFILNGCTRVTDRGILLIAKRCPEIRILETKGCPNITNLGIYELVTHCFHLDHLDVTGCQNVTCIHVIPIGAPQSDQGPPARQLYLQYVDLSDCFRVEDSDLRIIVRNCPQLLHFYLRRCMNITDIGVKHIANYCLALKEISVSDCVRVTDFGMYELAKLGSNLRYISVAKCDQISDAGIKQIARHCYKLRYLNVRGCEAVSDDSMEIIARSCPRLRALDVGKCDVTDNGLKLISKSCPNLKKLSVKSCDMITDIGIQFISYYCRGLQQLNIQDCQITMEGYRTVKKFCRRCIIEHTNPGFF